MKKILLLLWLGALASPNFAQQIKRVEIPVTNNSVAFFTIPMGEKGVLVMNQLAKTAFSIERYDTNLERQWLINGQVNNGLDYVTHSYDGQAVYLLFSKFRTNVFEVIKVNVGPGYIERFQLVSVDRLEVSAFKAINQGIFIAGMISNTPVVLYSNLTQRSIRVLPVAAPKSQIEIQAMELDTVNKSVNITFVSTRSKNYQLLVQSFDENGQRISQFGLDPQEEFAMMNGRLNAVSDSAQLMLGTYGYKSTIGSSRGPTSQGIYWTTVVNDEVIDMKMHSFTDFKNFFNFLKPRQKERMEKRIETRKEKGDDLRLDYRMLLHNIIQSGDQYILVAEAFNPEFRTNPNMMNPYGWGGWGMNPWMSSLYNPFGWGWGNWGMYSPYSSYYGFNNRNQQEMFDGWRYTHAIVAAFDKNGNLLWDNSIELKDIKTKSLKAMINARVDGNEVRVSYSNKGKLFVKIFKGDDVIKDTEESNIETNHQGDDVRETTNDDVDFWYDKYFVATGYQRIRNQVEGDRRNVFYLSKVMF
jgi:hypothetical protein